MSIVKLSDGTLRSSNCTFFTPNVTPKLRCPHCGVLYEDYIDVLSFCDKSTNELLCNECGTSLVSYDNKE